MILIKRGSESWKENFDKTNEVNISLKFLKNVKFTYDINLLITADVFIVTVPTPIDNSKIPFLGHLKEASQIIGNVLKIKKKENKLTSIPVVIYESTVYPGATEEVCIPEIEKNSGLCSSVDFHYGYSPERINPGDNKLKLTDIVKITSGNNQNSTDWIDKLYSSIEDLQNMFDQSCRGCKSYRKYSKGYKYRFSQ